MTHVPRFTVDLDIVGWWSGTNPLPNRHMKLANAEGTAGAKLVQRHEIFDDWIRIRNEWILIRKRKARSFSFHHTVYSGQELKDRMLQVGFADVTLYGGFDGDDCGLNSHRLIAVVHKAGQGKTKGY